MPMVPEFDGYVETTAGIEHQPGQHRAQQILGTRAHWPTRKSACASTLNGSKSMTTRARWPATSVVSTGARCVTTGDITFR